MRNAFAAEITAIAPEMDTLVLLSGDIGNRLFDKYKERCPDRFINCGVAEPNMITMAAGMAMSGLRPVAYTIASFITTRCLEQIRVDVCGHHAPVVIVGTGAGFSYAANGITHHACEDIAILRMMPGMTVVCPGDAMEVRQAIRAALRHDGPVYVRLGKKGEPVVHQTAPDLVLGRALTLRTGEDVCLLSTGNMLPTAVQIADNLAERNIAAGVVSLHTVKPLDENFLREAFSRHKLMVTLEEHSRMGGLGGAVAEWITDHDSVTARLLRIGSSDDFLHEAGGQGYARERMGLTPDAITEKIENALRRIDGAAEPAPVGSDI